MDNAYRKLFSPPRKEKQLSLYKNKGIQIKKITGPVVTQKKHK